MNARFHCAVDPLVRRSYVIVLISDFTILQDERTYRDFGIFYYAVINNSAGDISVARHVRRPITIPIWFLLYVRLTDSTFDKIKMVSGLEM
jgi:hypothetical protein